jgi:hypothetical protein
MALLTHLLGCDAPATLASIASSTGRPESEVEPDLAALLSAGKLRMRAFATPGGPVAFYWPCSLIPFRDESPIITSPFGSPFDHRGCLDRLSDAQLQQERAWLQAKYRSVNQEYERLQHAARIRVDRAAEADLDARTAKWAAANQEMLRDMLALTRRLNAAMTMARLLQDLRIRPETVGWNDEDEDFAA